MIWMMAFLLTYSAILSGKVKDFLNKCGKHFTYSRMGSYSCKKVEVEAPENIKYEVEYMDFQQIAETFKELGITDIPVIKNLINISERDGA